MPASPLTRSLATIDRLQTAVMPGSPRNHGIVTDPRTGKAWRRPGRVGDVRFVRIDLRGHRRNGMRPIALALDMLYEDFQSSTAGIVARQIDDLQQQRARTPTYGQDASQWRTPVDMVLRPLAAREEDGAVSIWAEVDAQAHEAHAAMGRLPFGDIVTREPHIRRDAVVVLGRDLDILVEESQDRLRAMQARQATLTASRRRSRGRKIGLTMSIVALVMALSIGTTFLLVPMLLACAIGVVHFSRSDRHWATVERWLSMTRDIQIPRRAGTRHPASAWTEIEQAIVRHAPEQMRVTASARESIERLGTIGAESTDPELHARIAMVTGGMASLLDSYRRPARMALDSEARELAIDLARSLAGLGATADQIRSDALASARDQFDTQRRYLETWGDHALLSPVA